MIDSYSLIGPGVFMDQQGRLFEKKAEDTYIPISNKYVEAEDRYVEKFLKEKGRDEQ